MPTINGPNGTVVNVDDENRLSTYSTSVSMEHHVNKDEGLAFSWYFSTTATAADDCIFYLKNNDGKDLVLEGMDLYVTTDAVVYAKLGGSGTYATATTAVVGANLNAGSGNVADVTAGKHTDIEGAGSTFSGGTEVGRWTYTDGTSYDTHHINFPMDLIVPKNQIFTFWAYTQTVVINGTVYGWFHAS